MQIFSKNFKKSPNLVTAENSGVDGGANQVPTYIVLSYYKVQMHIVLGHDRSNVVVVMVEN